MSELERALERVIGRDSLVVCIGNYMRRDDAAGLIVCRLVKSSIDTDRVVECEGGLENCLSIIGRLKPKRILVVDAADFNGEPGDVVLTDASNCDLNLELYSTHKIPLSMMKDFVEKAYNVESVWVLGIKPLDTSLGFGVSKRVLESCRRVAIAIIRVLSSL